jgi:signal transduction histidine kinase
MSTNVSSVSPPAANHRGRWIAGLLLAYVVTTLGSVAPYIFVLHAVSISVFWPPNGILTLLILMTTARERWWLAIGCGIANFLIEHFLGYYTSSQALEATGHNLAETFLTALLAMRFCGPEIDFSRLATLCRFALLCVIPAVLVVSTVGISISQSLHIYPGNVWLIWSHLVTQESFGIIMMTPALHTFVLQPDQDLFRRSALERITLFVLLLATIGALFGLSSTPALFAVPPILVGISFRLGPRDAAGAILITSFAVFGFAISGTGPFATFHQADLYGVGELLQIFILSVVYTVLPAAGAVAERIRAQEAFKRLHVELVDASRMAGRAEIATNVLHNVGNVLHSVNISAGLLAARTNKSPQRGLERLASHLRDKDLVTFAASPQGKLLPDFLQELAGTLESEQRSMSEEVAALRQNIDHINEIVQMQQSHAKRVSFATETDLGQLVNDAVRLAVPTLANDGISLVREFAEQLPAVVTDRHKVLDILVNLLRNARFAITESERPDKRITVRIAQGAQDATISVIDSGIGIPAENMPKIFTHGFTTRADGHGFGLHACSLAAIELGGSIRAHSPGRGHGATFDLILPVSPPQTATAA